MAVDVTLTVNGWDGPPPMPGIYLKAPKGRTAYEVLAFWSARAGSKIVGRLRCRRLEPKEIPAGATVIAWYWAQR
ncbi:MULTISPECIES: hypothetical protein [unclassified Xanthobacter]|uniref:hypothetical protein n=1 Tax=unclassified Xanthobacter TaxID=2623496 RepID=UPI001F2DA42B|nr:MULTISPECIES: hypothetical protein [unclassified Xanthobacter]